MRDSLVAPFANTWARDALAEWRVSVSEDASGIRMMARGVERQVATAGANWHFSRWAGDTNGCAPAGNVITAALTQARAADGAGAGVASWLERQRDWKYSSDSAAETFSTCPWIPALSAPGLHWIGPTRKTDACT